MSFLTDPFTYVNDKIEAFLKEKIPDITIYPEFPHMDPRTPCLVMQQITGSSKTPGIGEVVDATKRAHTVRLGYQFDVYHENPKKCREYAAKAFYELWKNNLAFKSNDGIEPDSSTRIQEPPSEEPGSRLYRKSFDLTFEVRMTAPL